MCRTTSNKTFWTTYFSDLSLPTFLLVYCVTAHKHKNNDENTNDNFKGLEWLGPATRAPTQFGRFVCPSPRWQCYPWIEQFGTVVRSTGKHWLSQPKRNSRYIMGNTVFTMSAVEFNCQFPSTFDPIVEKTSKGLSDPSIDSTVEYGWELHVSVAWKVSIYFSDLKLTILILAAWTCPGT